MNENINNTASPNQHELCFGHLVIRKGGEVVADWDGGSFKVNLSNQAHSEQIRNATEICHAIKEAIVGGLVEIGDHFFEKEKEQREANNAEREAAKKAEAESNAAYNKWAAEENAARLKDWEEELKEWKRQLALFKEEDAAWLQSDPKPRGSRPSFYRSRPSRPSLVSPRF